MNLKTKPPKRRIKKIKSNTMKYIKTTHKTILLVAIFAVIIQTAILSIASASATGPIAFWKFDENTGTNASDSSGYGNNGIVNAATWTTGKIGNALSFDGTKSYVNAGNGPSLNINGNQITLEAWVYPRALSESYIISKFNGDSVTSGYNLLITSSSVYFRLGDGTKSYQFAPSHGMSTNTWYHIVAVYDGTSMKIYKNGVALPGSTSFSGNIATNTNNVNMGQRVGDNSYKWNGIIDNVKIYNRALSSSEILAAFNGSNVDTTPPIISGIASSSITSTSATIGWTTDEASDTQVEYGTTTSYGYSTTLNTSLSLYHSQYLSGLSASTLYHYRVKSKDASGNLATSGDNSFTTAGTSSSTSSTNNSGGSSGSLKLTIDHTKIDGVLTDFPVLVHLGKSSGLNSADTSQVLTALVNDANRKKISVTTAAGTELYTEIEKWDSANKEAWLWVKVPSVSNTQDTILYLNYDVNRADNTAMVGDTRSAPAENVWSNGFVMVQHFEQSGSAKVGEYLDSTKRHNDGQGGQGTLSATPTKSASIIGAGQTFDGISDFISVPDSDDLSVTTTCQLTFSVWIDLGAQNFNSSDSYIRWIGKGYDSGNWEWHSVLYNQNANDADRLRIYDYNPSGGLGAGDYSTTSFTVGQWRYITGVNTCNDASHGNEWLYVDSVETGLPQTWQTYGLTYANGVAPLNIGNARGFYGKDWFNGKMDEVRISNVSRSQTWIKASYYAEKDSLLY